VPYERKGEVTVWADPLIEPGQQWEGEIFGKLDRAHIVILLLSNDFLNSYYCMDTELARTMDRHGKGECEIVPVVVRACRFDKLDIGKIQAIFADKPIQEHADRDRAWHEVRVHGDSEKWRPGMTDTEQSFQEIRSFPTDAQRTLIERVVRELGGAPSEQARRARPPDDPFLGLLADEPELADEIQRVATSVPPDRRPRLRPRPAPEGARRRRGERRARDLDLRCIEGLMGGSVLGD
jgi:hypothetical protein